MIQPYKEIFPRFHPTVYVDQTALVIGDVEIGQGSSVWFQSIVRGDVNYIRIGENTNIQDQCMVHVTKDRWPTFIGSFVTLGHKVLLHGCTIGDHCLIGMGTIILDGVEIGDNCLIGAGAVVTPGTKIPHHSVALGMPAKVVREMKKEDFEFMQGPLDQYTRLAVDYTKRNSNV